MELQALTSLLDMDLVELYQIFILKVSDSETEQDQEIYNKIRFGVNMNFDYEDILNGNIKDGGYFYKKSIHTEFFGTKVKDIPCFRIGKIRFDEKDRKLVKKELEDRKRLIIKWLMNNWEKVGLSVENNAGGTQ